jgi:hypothetical protein
MAYRITRNAEASIVDYITTQLVTDGWVCRMELDFSESYKGTLPCITVNADDRPDERREVGSDSLSNYFTVEIRVFANNAGERKDLRDWLLTKVMSGINYYTYVISNGTVSSKTLAGRISFIKILINRKELKNTDNTTLYDRERHLLSFDCRVALS